MPARNLRSSTVQAKLSAIRPLKGTAAASENVNVVEEKENVPPPTVLPRLPIGSRALSRIPLKPQWDDLDAEDAGDPLMVSEYVVEIFDYMMKLEVRNIC